MYSTRKRLVIIAFVGIAAAVICVLRTPSLPQSCQDYQDQAKQSVLNDSGLAGIIAVVDESTLEAELRAHEKGMSAEDCTRGLGPLKKEDAALSAASWGPRMRAAGDEATSASLQCRDKRVSGELKSHAEAAQCSNPAIAAAIAGAGYPYPDLVKRFTDMRADQAARIDKSTLGGSEDQAAFARLAIAINEEERKRVTGTNAAKGK